MQQDDATQAGPEVAAWLRAHPAFLAHNPALYDVLVPPRRVHGAGLADHMAAMLHQARVRAVEAEQASTLAAAGRRASESFTRRVQDAVIALMRAPDPAWLATHELAVLLRLDAARICSEASSLPAGATAVPRGTVAEMLGQRSALLRAGLPSALLHGEAVGLAAEQALVRVPLRSGPALLALACRDGVGLTGAATDTLAFLGQAVAAALERA